MPVTVLVGNPRPASRTLRVAGEVVQLVTAGLGRCGVAAAAPRVVELAPIAAELAAWQVDSVPLREATTAVVDCRLLVVASPTFKASYSGLLKLFLDRLPRRALAGVVAVPVMTAHDAEHAHAVDNCLRPVLLELGARIPARGLCVLEPDFAAVPASSAGWHAVATPLLAAALTTAAPAPVPLA